MSSQQIGSQRGKGIRMLHLNSDILVVETAGRLLGLLPVYIGKECSGC